jgi:FG-GAP-like repeat
VIKRAVAIAFLSAICSAAGAQSYSFGAGAFPVAQGPTAIVAADFNGDGRIDLAVADGNGVSVLLGKPDGSFAAKVDYSVGSITPTSLAVADVNGDGRLDLIVVAGSVEILIGNGNGTFQVATSVPYPMSAG